MFVGSQGFHQSLGGCLSRICGLDPIPIGLVLGVGITAPPLVGEGSSSDTGRNSSWPFLEFSWVCLVSSKGSASICSRFMLGFMIFLGFCLFLIGNFPLLNSAHSNMTVCHVDGM